LPLASGDGWDSRHRQEAAKGKKLLAGTGAESTAETIERTKRAAELGYDAALVKTPYYYKTAYKPDVLLAHYRRVADESPIPVMLYSIPQFTGIALTAAEVAALAEHPNIIGIKDSSGNVQGVARQLRRRLQNFRSWSVLPAVCIRRWQLVQEVQSWRWRARCRKSAWRYLNCSSRVTMRKRGTTSHPGPRLKIDRFRAQHRRRKVRHGPAGLPRRHPSPPASAPQRRAETARVRSARGIGAGYGPRVIFSNWI